MKKITLFFSLILIATLSFNSCDEAQLDPDEPQANDVIEFKTLNKSFKEMESLCGMQKDILWVHGNTWRNGYASGHTNGWTLDNNDDIEAGYVIVSNDGSNLYVTVHSESGFGKGNGYAIDNHRNNLDVWILDELPEADDNPCTNSGCNSWSDDGYGGVRHHAGKQMTENGEKDNTYIFPYSDLGINDDNCTPHKFYVVVRANVHHDKSGHYDTEAYAGCRHQERWGQKGWTYIEYETVCCGDCYCSFGYNYMDEKAGEEACIDTGNKFPGVDSFKLWSNRVTFSDIYKGPSDGKYVNTPNLLLVANSDTCTPLDGKGNIDTEGGEVNAKVVGKVFITGKMMNNGERFVDVEYFINSPEFDNAPVQLDLYIGSKRVPEYEFSKENIYIVETTGNDHSSEVYQTILFKGETSYKFENLPWPVNDDGTDAFITPHAAVGSCPDMPGMEGNNSDNDTGL